MRRCVDSGSGINISAKCLETGVGKVKKVVAAVSQLLTREQVWSGLNRLSAVKG